MDLLSPLCIDLIADHIVDNEPNYNIAKFASHLALVGNSDFADIAKILCETIEPNCTQKANAILKKYERLARI